MPPNSPSVAPGPLFSTRLDTPPAWNESISCLPLAAPPAAAKSEEFCPVRPAGPAAARETTWSIAPRLSTTSLRRGGPAGDLSSALRGRGRNVPRVGARNLAAAGTMALAEPRPAAVVSGSGR
jgi:hypothetical protein